MSYETEDFRADRRCALKRRSLRWPRGLVGRAAQCDRSRVAARSCAPRRGEQDG